MALLIILLLIVAAITGVLWQVLEVAWWVVSVIFIVLIAVAAAIYGAVRKRLSRS